jgi:hypothetical protein
MVALVDIVPQRRTVQLAAGELELGGLGLRQIADLFVTFPSLRNFFVPNAPEVGLEELILLAPDAIGTIIAEAAGQPEAAGKIAGSMMLAPDEVLDCLIAIRDLTFPRGGVAPLLARLTALLGGGAVGLPGRDPAMNTPPPPSNSSPPDMIAAE